MAARPQFPARFAYLDENLVGTGGPNKLRPPIEVREVGYDYLQKPPAEEFNWLLWHYGEWIQYLDDLTRDQGITEIATQQQAEEGTASDVLMTPATTLDSIKYNAVPPGNVQYSARTTAPTGWLVCDGGLYSRDLYPRLFAAIGTTFGSTTASNFRVPDLRDEFIRGANGVSRPVGTTESDSFRTHTHTGTTNNAGTHSHSRGTAQFSTIDGGTGSPTFRSGSSTSGRFDANLENTNLLTGEAGSHTHSFTTNATGGSETRPRNVALMPIIKF